MVFAIEADLRHVEQHKTMFGSKNYFGKKKTLKEKDFSN